MNYSFSGQCSKGEGCPFIHTPTEGRQAPNLNALSAYPTYPTYPGYPPSPYPPSPMNPTAAYPPRYPTNNPYNPYPLAVPYVQPLQRGPGLGGAPQQQMGGGAPGGVRFKTQTCKFFSTGQCRKGNGCPYIHGHGSANGDAPRVKKFAGTPDPMYKYKTEVCKFFEQGKCTKGPACPFKHSDQDEDAEFEGSTDTAMFDGM